MPCRAASASKEKMMHLGGIEIECRLVGVAAATFLVWLVSPAGDRLLFCESETHAEARACAEEASPVFGPVLRDDGDVRIQ